MRRVNRIESLGVILLTMMTLGATVTQVVGSSNASPHPRDFSIIASPTAFNLHPVENVSSVIMLTSIGGFSGVITLSAAISPNPSTAPTFSLSPSSLRLRSGSTANSTLTIFVTGQTGLANYTITVTAQDDKATHIAQVTVSVQPPPDFSLTLRPSSETVGLSTTRNSFYTLESFFGFSGTVTITPSNIPVGVGVGIQTPPPLTSGANFTEGLSINVDTNATPGSYGIVLTGQSGSTIHTAILSLTISSAPPPDFAIATSPSFLSIPQGSTGLVFVSLSSVGFNGTVSLTGGIIPVLSGGPSAVLNQSSVYLVAGFSRGVELRIITTPTTPTGSYNYTVTGTSGSLTHTAIGSFTITSSVPPPDFSISANPSALTIPQGSSSRIFLNLTSLNGFAGTINLNATVSPTGPRLVLGTNSLTLNSGGTTQVVLAVFVNATVPPPAGNYVITATGTSGSISHSVNVQLTVTSSSASLVLVSYNFQATNVTLQLHNTGGGTVSLSGYQAGDVSGDNWTRTGWPGPTLTPNATVLAVIAIGASCPSCNYAGVAGRFTQFTSGNTYLVTVVGFNGQTLMFTLTFSSAREGLSLDSYTFFSATNVTLFLRNIGNTSISLVSYYVKDASGDQYALISWPGPTITPGSLFPVQILIGPSCPNCTLVGTAFTFTPGQNYTIVLVTGRNNQFSFTVTR